MDGCVRNRRESRSVGGRRFAPDPDGDSRERIGSAPGRKSVMVLLEFDLGASLFELLLGGFGGVLGSAFEDRWPERFRRASWRRQGRDR